MSNYVKTTNFTSKDSLSTGTAAKRLKGTELDTEFDNIAASVATKEDTVNKAAASGYASLDSSTLVPRAQLGTGTPSAVKYLRGDGSWQPESNFVQAGSSLAAATITYDHSASGLAATQVQAAIDELAASLIPTSTALVIAQNTVNWNLIEALGGTPGSSTTVAITVKQGVLVTSLSPTSPAMDLTGLPAGSVINLTNLGSIIGRGGRGGQGGAAENHGGGDLSHSASGSNGRPGGDAIKGPGASNTLNLFNAAGYIYGAGGGGGGGSWGVVGNGDAAGGGGGGGGAGGGEGGEGGSTEVNGTPCKGVAGGTAGIGRLDTGSAGGANTIVASGTAGNGGNGGVYGSAGASGSIGNFGTGGASGKAVAATGGTVNFSSGTNSSPHVKGAVS